LKAVSVRELQTQKFGYVSKPKSQERQITKHTIGVSKSAALLLALYPGPATEDQGTHVLGCEMKCTLYTKWAALLAKPKIYGSRRTVC
jgi:hypothetical protein